MGVGGGTYASSNGDAQGSRCRSPRAGEKAALNLERDRDVKVTKLTDKDDIEAYLTTFKRLMKVYDIKVDRWSFKLAPQLVGKAQQA